MNTFFRARRTRFSYLIAAVFLMRSLPSQAQRATGDAGNFRFGADRATTPGGIPNGSLRLEGNVRLYTPDSKTSPQVDLSAPLITADIKGGRVRGQGGVSLKYGGVRQASKTQASKADEPPVPIQVEAQAREVLLETVNGRRTLTLTGDLSGFYKIGDDVTSLDGQKAVISFGKKPNDIQATFDGGANGFGLTLPAQNFGAQIPLGAVTLRGGRVAYDQFKNTGRIEGGARLTSDGPAKLQISGAAFDAAFATQKVMVKGKDSTTRSLSRLSSSGRVTVSLALPPEGIAAPYAGTSDATYPLSATSAILRLVPQPTPQPTPVQNSSQPLPSATGNGSATTSTSSDLLKKPDTTMVPVSLEISADSAVIEPQPKSQTLMLTLTGSVRGSYVLREVLVSNQAAIVKPVAKPSVPAAGDGEATAGTADKTPLSLDLDIRGAQIELPSSFGFDL